jgi:hypothetical protein
MNNILKKSYVMQPYQVGGKDYKSLALIIPSKVVQAFEIDISTIFQMIVDDQHKTLNLQMIK